MIDLTPETLAELRRLMAAVDGLHGTPRRGGKTYARETLAVAAVNALPALLAAAAERDALREQIEADPLRAMLAGRCLSGITHRDEEHRQSFCMLPAEHAPLAHDDCMGCTWTDADHWQPSAVDRVADEVQRIAAESQHEGWDGPLVRILVGRISAALGETTA